MAQKGAHPKPAGYWLSWRNVKRELLAYNQKHRHLGVMPSLTRLRQQGYGGLASAIKRLGGARVVARRLKLRPEPRVYKNLPGHWTWERTLNELREFMRKHGLQAMPSGHFLQRSGRGDLLAGLVHHGGILAVARRADIPATGRHKPNGYWTFTTLKREVRAFISQHDLPENVLPNHAALLAAKRGDLANGIRRLGGAYVVRKRLGLGSATAYKAVQRPETKLKILKRELPPFMAKRRLKSLPSTVYLIKAGRADLVRCIRLCGGIRPVAQALGLPMTSRQSRLADQYWMNFKNVAKEVRAFMAAQGLVDVLPSAAKMREAGRGDLSGAIASWGRREVARRLGLRLTPSRWDKVQVQ